MNPGDCEACYAWLKRIRIVLVETTHPGNIGAVARAMKSMGLSDLALVRPRHFPSAEATARAAGADDLLVAARVTADVMSAINDAVWVVGATARSRHISWPIMEPHQFAAAAMEHQGPVAMLFGREHAGLTNAELDYCQTVVTIPTAEHFQSLNVAAAVQILAYELRRLCLRQKPLAPPQSPPAPEPAVTSSEMEGFYAHLEQTLIGIGYLDHQHPRLMMRRLRRLFNRAQPSRPELNILRGMLSATDRLPPLSQSSLPLPSGSG